MASAPVLSRAFLCQAGERSDRAATLASMCGRYNLRLTSSELQQFFGTVGAPAVSPRYNIAPPQQILFIHQTDAGRVVDSGPWGIRPSWNPKQNIINARSETVFTSKVFAKSARERRCIVPVSGFYEWQAVGKQKQPWHIWLASGDPIAFAAFTDADGAVCTMTTEPNAEMAQIHDRMPVILPRETWGHFLDPAVTDPEEVQPLLVPLPDGSLTMQAVSKVVSNARNETPECIKPVEGGLL